MAQSQNELAKGILEIANKTQVLGWDWWLVAFAVNQRTHDPALQPSSSSTGFTLDVVPRQLYSTGINQAGNSFINATVLTAANWRYVNGNLGGLNNSSVYPSNGAGKTQIQIIDTFNNMSAGGSLNFSNGLLTKQITILNKAVVASPKNWMYNGATIKFVQGLNIGGFTEISGLWLNDQYPAGTLIEAASNTFGWNQFGSGSQAYIPTIINPSYMPYTFLSGYYVMTFPTPPTVVSPWPLYPNQTAFYLQFSWPYDLSESYPFTTYDNPWPYYQNVLMQDANNEYHIAGTIQWDWSKV